MELREVIEKLDREFLNNFNIIKGVIEAALFNQYCGSVSMTFRESQNLDHIGATYRIRASGNLAWDNEHSWWRGSATIEWWTGSRHYVRLDFEQDEQFGPVELVAVKRGDDESRFFYPTIEELFEDVAVVPVPDWP